MFEHIFPVRVYFADTDSLGIVHHSTFIRFLEQARTEALRAQGIELPNLLKTYGAQFAVTNLEICYNKPARVDELLQIRTILQEKRKASLIYLQQVYLAEIDGPIVCQAEIKLVCLDVEMKPRVLPIML